MFTQTAPSTVLTKKSNMLDTAIRLSLRYRFLVIVISLILLVYGSWLSTTMTIDVFPDLDRPRVIILTECPGLATEEVETLVTHPIEISLLGANGVEAVRSQSTAGLNVIYIEFGWDVEIREARQTVQERLSTLTGVLPNGINPQMTPPSSIMGQIVIAGMYRQKGPTGGQLAAVDNSDYWLNSLIMKAPSRLSSFGIQSIDTNLKRGLPLSWTTTRWTHSIQLASKTLLRLLRPLSMEKISRSYSHLNFNNESNSGRSGIG